MQYRNFFIYSTVHMYVTHSFNLIKTLKQRKIGLELRDKDNYKWCKTIILVIF